MRRLVSSLLSSALFAWVGVAAAGEQLVAIQADRIDTVTKGVIENGVILIRGAKISRIGAEVEIPGDARRIDARDKTVFPGLVSPVSVIGLSAAPRGDLASRARYRVADELYPHQHAYRRALQAGFTTLGLIPAGQGIAGQGAVVRPLGETRQEMIVAESGFLWIGFQASEKTNSLLRKALQSAKGKQKSDDPEIAPIARALEGEIPTLVSCDRPADTLHLLEIVQEHPKMKVVLVVGAENYRVADRLAKQKLAVVAAAKIDFELFTRDRINVPNMLARAGVNIACAPKGGDIEAHEDFRRAMAELVKCGLDRETAKKAMTIRPAEALGVEYRLGSLEPGKDANLLVVDGDVLDPTAMIRQVMLEGKIVYENPWGKTQ
jgi:imidazolonepropionase-like amidohydrolase